MCFNTPDFKKIFFFNIIFLFSFYGFSQGILQVKGNGQIINRGSINPKLTNYTDFGEVNGSKIYSFELKNIASKKGNKNLKKVNVTITGSSDFSIIQNASGNIKSGGKQNIKIKFTPSSSGIKKATITITYNNGKYSSYSFDIQGMSSNKEPEIDVTDNFDNQIEDNSTNSPLLTNNTDFGSIDVGTSVTVTFRIYNIGTNGSKLNVFNPVLIANTSGYFSVSNLASTKKINQGKFTTFTITFTPISLGTFSAEVSISNDDADENPYTFTVRGTSVPPLTIGPGGVVTDLKLWLKANENVSTNSNNGVTLWGDNARGSDATVNTSGQEPTFRDDTTYNLNFNPVIDFDNNSTSSSNSFDYTKLPQQYLEGALGYYSNEIFVVVIPDATVNSTFGVMDIFCSDSDTGNMENDASGLGFGAYSQRFNNEVISYAYGISSGFNDGFGVAQTGTANYTNAGIINTRNNTSTNNQELFYNAKNIANTTSDIVSFGNISNGKYWIGRSEGSTASLNGRIAEIITYSVRKNDTNLIQERNRIQSYLAIKYGITLGDNGVSQDYVDSNGTIIWDQSVNTGFNYDIAGIGRDDVSSLNQKQSKSINNNGIVAIGLGEVATTNNLNLGSFNTDRDYLVWGNNNGGFTTASQSSRTINLSGTATTFIPIARKWKITESQNDVPEVKVSIPSSILTNNISLNSNEKYVLIVSDNNTFNASDIVDVIPLELKGVNFETWYDFDTTKYFTFGKVTKVEQKSQIDFSTHEFLLGDESLELGTNFTVSAWIKSNGAAGSFISKGANGYNFKVNANNFIEIDWNGSTQITSINAIDNLWHHIVLTFNGGAAKLYIDGILDSTINGLTSPSTNHHKFAIGALYTDKNNIDSFKGSIDEVRIWNESLTVEEIRYIMNQEIEEFSTKVNGKVLPQSISKNDIISKSWASLQAYFNMNSFYGTVVEDVSNNDNFIRIKYLSKNKHVVKNQSAPLPYVSVNVNASIPLNWDDTSSWENGSNLMIPNVIGLDGKTKIDWNIVETRDYINSGNRSIKLLGLINSEDELSINTANKLEISHYLLINGVIDLDGESQLIQTTDSDFDLINSTGYLERDQQGVGNKFRYNDWSSPVISNVSPKKYAVASVLKDGTDETNPIDIDFVGGYNGDNTTTPIQIANYWIYAYKNKIHDSYSSWEQIGSSGQLKAGEGFLMKGTANPGVLTEQNYVFVGKPNNGDISLHVSGTNDYLIGNPYPSAIDAYKFIDDNTASLGNNGTLYFWEHYGGDSHNLKDYQAGFATLTKLGGVKATTHPINNQSVPNGSKVPQQFIAVGQGFFVQGDSDGGNIVFKNSQRAFVTEEDPKNSIFMKGGVSSIVNKEENLDKRLKIRLGFEATKIQHRQLLLTIDENTTNEVDWGYDAPIYEEFKDDMYWLIDNKKFVIQGTNTISAETEIPLGIKSNGGMVKIGVDALENTPDDFKVYIKDLNSGETFNITQNNFEIELAEGVYKDRFVVAFQPRLKTIQEISVNEGVLVFMNNSTNELQVNKILDTEIQNISLCNYLGQIVNTWNKGFNGRNNSFPVNVSSGAYIVKVHTSNGNIIKKIVIQ